MSGYNPCCTGGRILAGPIQPAHHTQLSGAHAGLQIVQILRGADSDHTDMLRVLAPRPMLRQQSPACEGSNRLCQQPPVRTTCALILVSNSKGYELVRKLALARTARQPPRSLEVAIWRFETTAVPERVKARVAVDSDKMGRISGRGRKNAVAVNSCTKASCSQF